MKLLMTADAVGGVWPYATELAAALVPHGVRTVIAVLGPAPDADQLAVVAAGVEVVVTGLPLDWLADGPAPVRDAAGRIAAMAEEMRADLVQLNSPALAAAAAFPCPVVAVAHGCVATWWDAAEATPLPDLFGWLAAMTRDGLDRAAAVVAPSASYAAIVQRRYDLSRAPVVVHNGRSAPVPAAPGSPADHVFTAGRLWDRVKNTALLDQVAARLPVPVRAAGPVTAPQGDTVRPAHLTLLGNVPAADLARELAQRPVFVSAASFEPFGLAVLEAAQAGCALVLSDIATFRELWDGAALFVAGWDPQDWVTALADLLADPERRQALGDRAAERAARYTPAATAAVMMRVYAQALLRAERVAA
jgi:glycosyltransferase involved in cell wall biosynthesis